VEYGAGPRRGQVRLAAILAAARHSGMGHPGRIRAASAPAGFPLPALFPHGPWHGSAYTHPAGDRWQSSLHLAMFTGLIHAVGRTVAVEPQASGGGARLQIDPRGWDYLPAPGDSIAINGCCLTVTANPPRGSNGRTFAFDAVAETLSKTTLGDLKAGSLVNMERSLAAGDLMGGHFVQGHVEGVAEVVRVDDARGDYRVVMRPPQSLMPAIVPKGSVTVDGVSLTVAEVDVPARQFSVALIPTTLEVTTMGALRAGSKVNLETDVISRTVVHWLAQFGGTP
jgi:riboflavin synthase